MTKVTSSNGDSFVEATAVCATCGDEADIAVVATDNTRWMRTGSHTASTKVSRMSVLFACDGHKQAIAESMLISPFDSAGFLPAADYL